MTKHRVRKERTFDFDKPTRLLLDLVRLDPPAALQGSFQALKVEDWRRLLTVSRQQHLCPLVYHQLKRLNLLPTVPSEIERELKQRYLGSVASNLKLYDELKVVARHLQQAGIPVIVLKGAHLAHAVYGNIGLREMLDLDLLVPRDQLFQAYEAVQGLGYHPGEGESVSADHRLNHRHLPGLQCASGHEIEIHWHLALPVKWPAEELWKRAVSFRYQDTEVLALSPEDLLLHLCYHLAYDHHFNLGLRPLIDIARVVSCFGDNLDWQLIEGRAGRYGLRKGVMLALAVAKAVVSAEVPDSMCGDDSLPRKTAISLVLNPASWRKVPPNLGRVWQEGRLHDKLRILAGRIFIPPQELAARYQLDPASPLRHWYYLVRFKDLLVDNFWTVGKRNQLSELIRQYAEMKSWLGK